LIFGLVVHHLVLIGWGGLERKGMQFAAHTPAKGFINNLMLLDAGFAAKFFGHYMASVMITIAAQIGNGDVSAGQRFFDQAFNLLRFHGHGNSLFMIVEP
jgi:hypothetical protein